MSVDVIAEMDFAVLIGERRAVHDENWNAPHEIHGYIIVSVLHSLLHSLQRPIWIIPQDPRGQFGGFLDPYAAMAEITPGARERSLRGRAMKIDVVLIGEYQLDQAERVRRSGLLPYRSLSRSELSQYFIGNGS